MQIKDILKKNAVYTAIEPQLKDYELGYLGGLAFKESVRKKRPSEDVNLWTDLIRNTQAAPICRYIVDTVNDVLFSTGVSRTVQFCTPQGEYIDPRNSEWANLFMLDADLLNNSLDAFMEQIGDLTSIFGHAWVAVDMPPAGETSLGRPYVVAINPLNVWDWEFDYIGGRPILKYVKILEQDTEEYLHFKCYYLGEGAQPTTWKSYEVDKKDLVNQNAQAELEGYGEFPAGMSIPVFLAYGRRDPRRIDIGISDIDSAVDAQKEHYKLECEAYTAIQFAHTIIRAETGIKIPVHAGAIVRATEGQVEAISVDTGDVSTIISKQEDILNTCESLSGLSGLRNNKRAVQSGISIIEERKQLHRMAKAKARLMEVVEEMIFTYAARFMGVRWAGEVVYATDYESQDVVLRMALMKETKTIAPDNEILNNIIVKELIGFMSPPTQKMTYQNLFVSTMPDSPIKAAFVEEERQIMSRDLGASMIPEDPEYNEDGLILVEDDSEDEYDSEDDIGGSPYVAIEDTGPSLEPQQSAVEMLGKLNTGR